MIALIIYTLVGTLFLGNYEVQAPTDSPIETPLTSVYQSCCGIEPVEFESANSYVYVPNVLLLEGSEKNSRFMPYCSENIEYITYMTITVDSETSQEVIYETAEFSVKDLETRAWNGMAQDGKMHNGSFTYQMYFNTRDGEAFTIRGRGCAISCTAENEVILRNEACFFPSQYDEDTQRLNREKSLDEDCF